MIEFEVDSLEDMKEFFIGDLDSKQLKIINKRIQLIFPKLNNVNTFFREKDFIDKHIRVYKTSKNIAFVQYTYEDRFLFIDLIMSTGGGFLPYILKTLKQYSDHYGMEGIQLKVSDDSSEFLIPMYEKHGFELITSDEDNIYMLLK